MKTQADPTKEQQHTPPQRTQKAPSAAATLADHRLQTVYQRQLLTGIRQSPQVLQAKAMSEGINNSPRVQKDAPLQAAMQAHAKAKAAPVQRMAAKGSSRFRQIAAEMGAAYGVDTSGLSATHHSTFPARLHAEATIQGRNIHFAPGKDTDHNIRHEVAHAIDNTLNGTPKGDQRVNGHKIDTTRERVVHGMINQGGSIIQRNASSDLHALSFSEGVFQLKSQLIPLDTEIDPNKLNVVGEVHPESDIRRDTEKSYTRETFRKKASYWEEDEMRKEYKNQDIIKFADSGFLRANQKLHAIWCRIKDLIAELTSWNTPNMPGSVEKLSSLYKILETIQLWMDDFKGEINLFSSTIIWDPYMKPDRRVGTNKRYTEFFNLHLKDFRADLHEIDKNDYKEQQHIDTLRSKAENLDKKIEKFLHSEFSQILKEEDMKTLLSYRGGQGEDITTGSGSPITNLRDVVMQGFAHTNYLMKGIWKVGDNHIYGIQKLENTMDNYRREYNLINKESFDRILDDWGKNRRETCGLFCLPSGIFPRW